jgi:3',5'-cyclic AMP phosphodiesterase CpdA
MSHTVLLTLVHVSDLHVGRIDRQGNPVVPDAVVRDWWRYSRRFHGLLGHSYIAMAQLEEFFADTVAKGPTRLVVTGDLTTCGSEAEFDLAEAFITGEAVLSRERVLGLCAADALALTIPGNHDHWPGAGTVFGDPTYRLWDMFPRRPLSPTVVDLDEDHRVVFFGINTDEDVHPTGTSRLYARGHFVSQLDALDRLLAGEEWRDGDSRVLLMHHSRMHQAFELGLTAATRRRLDRTLAAGRISVILSGHVHEPQVEIEPIARGDAAWDLLEARCGTTTQRDELPKSWIERGVVAALQPNGLLVHEIVRAGTRLEWHTIPYERTDRGFRPGPALRRNRPVVISR